MQRLEFDEAIMYCYSMLELLHERNQQCSRHLTKGSCNKGDRSLKRETVGMQSTQADLRVPCNMKETNTTANTS